MKTFSGVHVCITGTLSVVRHDFQSMLTAAGAVVQNSVTARTDVLICGAKTGATKLDKARSLGIECIDEAEARNRLRAAARAAAGPTLSIAADGSLFVGSDSIVIRESEFRADREVAEVLWSAGAAHEAVRFDDGWVHLEGEIPAGALEALLDELIEHVLTEDVALHVEDAGKLVLSTGHELKVVAGA